MSKKDEWGNLELPGLNDDLLFDPKVNIKIANKAKGRKFKEEGTFKGENNPRYGVKINPEDHPKGFFGKTHTDSSKKMMTHKGSSNGMFGVSLCDTENGFYGKTHSLENKSKFTDIALNRKKDNYCKHCNEYYTAQAFKQHHGEHCIANPNRIVKERKKMAKEICPHCGIEAAPKAFARLHGDNCKKKLK
jgi:hypothetical protein